MRNVAILTALAVLLIAATPAPAHAFWRSVAGGAIGAIAGPPIFHGLMNAYHEWQWRHRGPPAYAYGYGPPRYVYHRGPPPCYYEGWC